MEHFLFTHRKFKQWIWYFHTANTEKGMIKPKPGIVAMGKWTSEKMHQQHIREMRNSNNMALEIH